MSNVDQVVNEYAMDNLRRSIERILSIAEPNDPVCRCEDCLYKVVNDVNYWIDFCEQLIPEEAMGHYYVMEYNGGSLSIVFMSASEEKKL